MEDEEMEKKVQQYLQRKGFRLTELALQEERNRLSTSAVSDVALARPENDPARYSYGYGRLRTWAYSSLDQYKHELLRILYPVFIHCFMDLVAEGHMQEARSFFHTFREDHEVMHSRDLQKLEGVLSPSHLEEMELARSLRQNKFKIKLCEYSYELLLQYLQKTQALVVLGIINEHITFEVSPVQPSLISDDADVVALIGTSKDLAKQINQKEVQWGLLEDSVEERMEKALSDSDKIEAESKDADAEDNNKKRNAEGGKQGTCKKTKKDKLVGATGKNIKTETSMVSVAPRVKSELTLPATPVEVEQSILEDLRNRAQLNSLALPSVSFYTFLNTHNGLNCSSISHDGSLVVGGFSDSSVKVWDMSKIGQPTKTSSAAASQQEYGACNKDQELQRTRNKAMFTRQYDKSLDQYTPYPALSSVKCSDIKIFRTWQQPMKRSAEVFSNVRKAQCVLFTSFYELEASAIDALSQVVPYPPYAVGPSIPHVPLNGDTEKIHHEEHIKWLDAQPKDSVLYVSFGSFVSLSSSQLDEFAMGLHDSGVRFFWVARDNATTTSLQQISGDKGLVVPWCDQLKILCHPSVGGFLSHCGWNSTLEAVFAGVPLLAFPIAWDQLVIGQLVANEWKIGINLREQKNENGIVSRAAVSAAVTKLMDLGDGDSQETRRRAEKLRQASRSAIQEGGSSWRSLSDFVEEIIKGRLNVAEITQ